MTISILRVKDADELDSFRLHVYNSNDVIGDASFIVEGKDGLVVMEYPLFKENADAESFLAALNAAYPELPGDAAALANTLYTAK